MEKHIETIARGVCIMDGKVLLCLPKDRSYSYLPGGHIEFGETGREALVREMKEETGLDATAGDLLGVVESSFMQKGEKHCEINLIYKMEVALPTAVEKRRSGVSPLQNVEVEKRGSGVSPLQNVEVEKRGSGVSPLQNLKSCESWICFDWVDCDKIDSANLLPPEMKQQLSAAIGGNR